MFGSSLRRAVEDISGEIALFGGVTFNGTLGRM